MPFILYVYLLLFIKLSLSKINAIKLLIIYHASTVLFPIKKILNIDKYFVCESRDMSDESGTYIILLKLKTILFTWPKYTYFKMSK